MTGYLDDNARSGPTAFWLIAIGVGVLLTVASLLPWIRLAPSDEQEANYSWIEGHIEAVRTDAAVQEVLAAVGIDPQAEFTPATVIDRECWSGLRLRIEAGQQLNAWWLLTAAEPAFLPRAAVGLQVLLILLVLAWCIQSLVTNNITLERLLGSCMAAIAILGAVILIINLPRIDTLGYDNSFGLALLMTIIEARPGWGLWLSLIGDAVLAGTMATYLSLGESAWSRPSDLWGSESDPYYGG